MAFILKDGWSFMIPLERPGEPLFLCLAQGIVSAAVAACLVTENRLFLTGLKA